MKKLLVIASAGLAAACVAEAPQGIEMTAAAQADLGAELAGRVAGPPVACVNQRQLNGPRSGGPGVLVFEGPGDVVYVNRTGGNCGDLKNNRSVRFRTVSTQLCRGDLAQTFDPYSGVQGSFCTLGDFTPYRTAR